MEQAHYRDSKQRDEFMAIVWKRLKYDTTFQTVYGSSHTGIHYHGWVKPPRDLDR